LSFLSAARRVREVLLHPDLTPELKGQLSCVLERKLLLYRRAPLWCVPELPRRTASHLGLNSALCDDLVAASILYHCAADIVDDAQDDDLAAIPGWGHWGWRDAVNVGLFLLSAQARCLAQTNVEPEVRAVWADTFARAGMTLVAGQHRDLCASANTVWDETSILGLGAQKAGGALAAVLCLAPAVCRVPNLNEWWEFGVLLGKMFQAASDLEAYLCFGPHSDLAQLKVTLPLMVAKDLDPQVAEMLGAPLPLSRAFQERLRLAVRASGALEYTQWRISALHQEAMGLAAQLGKGEYASLIRPVLDTAIIRVDPLAV
jgi:geranylgeranyl pyrophosphate synthase